MTSSTRVSPRTFYARTFALVAAAVAATLLFLVLEPVWHALAWAMVLAVLLRPLQVWLAARFGRRPGIAAGLLTFGTLLVILGPVSGLIGAFGAEVAQLAESAQERLGESGKPARLPELREVPVAGAPLDELRKSLGVSSASVRQFMNRGFTAMVQALGPLSGKLFVGALDTLTTFAIMLVVLFFFLRDGHAVRLRLDALVPWPRATKNRLGAHLDGVLRAVVFGTLVTATLQGVLVGIAFAVLGLPGPVVFGALAGLLATIPVGGTALIWGPAALFLLLDDRWGAGMGLLAWGTLLVSTVDNLLRPVLVAGRAEVGTLTVFVGVIGGLGAFGVLGLVLGPLVLCLVISLLELVRERAASG
jgi:predicted PurR-regulated permease PerM